MHRKSWVEGSCEVAHYVTRSFMLHQNSIDSIQLLQSLCISESIFSTAQNLSLTQVQKGPKLPSLESINN